MAELFRNSSPGALTFEQAVAHAKKLIAKRLRQEQRARELAEQGRGGDTEIAHVARGEFVIPEVLQTPELMAALYRAAAIYNIPLEKFRIGNASNSINPDTGAPEFRFNRLSGLGWNGGMESNEYAPSVQMAQNIQAPDNDNLAGGVCRTAGYECLEHAQGETQIRACHTAEQACQETARAAPTFPENASVVARFPHGRTVIIPGGRVPPYLGPLGPRRY